jgi:hypothetical protein
MHQLTLGSRSGLPNNQREMINELQIGNFLRGLLDGMTNLGIKNTYPVSTISQNDHLPSRMFALAAASFTIPKARTTGGGILSAG